MTLTREKIIAALAVVLAVASPAAAAPAFRKEFEPGGPTCFVNRVAAERNALRHQSLKQAGTPKTLTPKILVVRVDFTDLAMTSTKADAEAFFENVRGFYLENSYGVFMPSFTVTTEVYTIGGLTTYGADCGTDIACHDAALRQAAVAAEQAAGGSLAPYDQLMIYHAGNGEETTGASNDIWSVYFPDDFTANGKTFNGFTVVPETEGANIDPLGVICHEYGHQLGLPDLYDTSVSGGASTVGAWDLMDYPYAAAPGGKKGGSPSHLGAWSKKFLGFLTPSSCARVGTYSFPSVDVASAAGSVPIAVADAGPSNEYFLIEYRNKSSTATFDKGIPASGFLIWHIDESIASNPVRLGKNDVNSPSLSGQGHRGVELVEADGTERYNNPAHGEAGDAFGVGSTFFSPQSDAFNGLQSGAVIAGFSGVDTNAASFALDIPPIYTIASSASVRVSSSVATSNGFLSLGIPAGTFSDRTNVFLAAISANTFDQLGTRSLVADLTGTGVGCLVGAEFGAQPAQAVALSMNFANVPALTSLSSLEMPRLVVARYIPAARTWVPLPSAVDEPNKTVTAELDHFSMFQVMRLAPAASAADVKVFPNPLRPALGATYAVMNFSNMAPNARVRIYSLTGELVRDLRADGVGLAVWDGRNDAGRLAGSGTYFAVVENADGGGRRILKAAVER